MTRKQYIDMLQAELTGGAVTDEVLVNFRLIGGLLDIAREKAIAAYVKQNKKIPAKLYQTTYPIFRADNQESDCYTVFQMPSEVIQLDQTRDGFGYIGGMDMVSPWITSADQSDLANSMQHPIMASVMNRIPTAVYIPEFNQLKVNKTPGNLPKRFVVTAVFSRPDLIPEYNEQLDDYPITMEIFSAAKDYLLQVDIRQLLSTNPDMISNSAADSTVMQKPRK